MLRWLRNRYGYRLRNHLAVSLWAIQNDARKVRAVAFAVSGGLMPLFQSGAPKPTMTTTTATITAGMVVEITGDRSVGPAAANSLKAIGVAAQTGSAIGDKIAVDTGGVYMLKASGAIAAGDFVKAGALGVVVAIAADGDPRLIVGQALSAIADTVTGPVLLRIG